MQNPNGQLPTDTDCFLIAVYCTAGGLSPFTFVCHGLCGSMIHNGLLIIPYGISDQISTIATVPVDDLLSAMKSP